MSEKQDERNEYEAVKEAICAARDAFLTLDGESRKKIVREVFGITDPFSVVKVIRDFLR